MEEIYQLDDIANQLYNLILDARAMTAKPFSEEINSELMSAEHSFVNFQKGIKENEPNKIIYYGAILASIGSKLSYDLDLTDGVPPPVTHKLQVKTKEFKQLIGLYSEKYDLLGNANENIAAIRNTEDKLKEIADEQVKHDQRIKKLLTENELRIAELESKLAGLSDKASIEIQKITLAYSASLTEIELKKTQIDNILGHVAGRAIAGDYEKSATEEREMADWLRAGSLFCMALIAASLGYSFWETISTEFDWQKSIFRITLTFLLSVPAAYLARESAKHREQQYQHLQTSLDLKAISPFLASLPEDEQHKIKIAIASKIFAGRDFSKVSADPYPLNTHEIIIELIKRFDPAKANSKPTNDATEPK